MKYSWFTMLCFWCTTKNDSYAYIMAFLMAQMVKNLPEMQETRVWSLEKGMATHSSILAWKIPWQVTESMGSQRAEPWVTNNNKGMSFSFTHIVACDIIAFLFNAEQHSIVCTMFCFSSVRDTSCLLLLTGEYCCCGYRYTCGTFLLLSHVTILPV